MKYKNTIKALLLFGVFAFTGCSANTSSIDISQVSDIDMPEPFEHNGGDENNDFFHPCNLKFDNVIDLVCDLANDENAVQSWVEEMNKNETPYQIDDYINLYSFMIHFDVSGEEVCAALQEFNEMQERWRDERDIPINSSTYYTAEDFEAMKSEDKTTITNHFASEFSIIVDDKIYSPNWVYYHTSDDYEKCGITADAIKEHIDKYAQINFDSEAAIVFENKLSDFTGASVSLQNGSTLSQNSDISSAIENNTTDISLDNPVPED